MAKWRLILISVIIVLLLPEFIAGQLDKIESSEITGTQTSGANQDFGPIEYAIPSEKNLNIANIAIKPRSNLEIYLSLGILAFGLVLIAFTGFVALKKNSGWNQEATRIFAVSIIVTAGLFLITAGYSDQQIAPMFGLLGTIVGYLLGKSPSGEQSPK